MDNIFYYVKDNFIEYESNCNNDVISLQEISYLMQHQNRLDEKTKEVELYNQKMELKKLDQREKLNNMFI